MPCSSSHSIAAKVSHRVQYYVSSAVQGNIAMSCDSALFVWGRVVSCYGSVGVMCSVMWKCVEVSTLLHVHAIWYIINHAMRIG
jgi:hypothetical protein